MNIESIYSLPPEVSETGEVSMKKDKKEIKKQREEMQTELKSMLLSRHPNQSNFTLKQKKDLAKFVAKGLFQDQMEVKSWVSAREAI